MLLFLELTVSLYCTAQGSPGRFGDTCACLLLCLGNHLYSDFVLISSPPPSPPFYCEKKPVKTSIWQRSCPDLRRKFPGFMSSLFCSSINWRENLLHSYSGVRGPGWGELGALGLLLRPEKHFASAEWLLACQNAVVFSPDSVLGKDSGCESKALVLLIIHQS